MKRFTASSRSTAVKILSILSVVFMLTLTACGGGSTSGKYGDIKGFINDVITSQNNYVSSVKSAGSPDDIVKALNAFGDDMIKFAVKGDELKKKYPELDKWGKKPPAELESTFKKLEENSKNVGQAMSDPKVRKYMMDPKVLKAAMEMGKKLQKSNVFK